MMTAKNPYDVVMSVIHQLRQNFLEKRTIIQVVSSKGLPTTLCYDWQIFSCILWNQLLSCVSRIGENRIILIELSLVKKSAAK